MSVRDRYAARRVVQRVDPIVRPPLEMWAGAECTINRVGDRTRDQLELAGHYGRVDDAERIADLGVAAVRWPILWERHQGDAHAWKHTDRALDTFRRRGVRVIAGLLHHGSGPRHTNLLADNFGSGLERFAHEVAERYPWIHDYTPINEPLTTARFSALYGIWYPHQYSDGAFVGALLSQIGGIQRAMRAIRRVTPDARLIATEDLGFTHTTRPLREQGTFENERRWLTWDLLAGKVRPGHALWQWLCRYVPARRSLSEIADAASDHGLRPAMLGVNHYVTSERFLDEDAGRYPNRARGGNGDCTYADVEAVRVLRNGLLGHELLLEQASDRYRMPIAVTEVHLSCTREQQMLWLQQAWTTASRLRDRGHDIRAITSWALFGAYDWRSLLVKDERAYESGAFDLRAPAPRPTALVPMIHALATRGSYEHPVLKSDPWWSGPRRLQYPAQDGFGRGAAPARGVPGRVARLGVARRSTAPVRSTTRQPVVITGASGTLGHALHRVAQERGLAIIALSRHQCDVTDAGAFERWLDETTPWAVINAAGWVQVDAAESMQDACMRINAEAAGALATACHRRDIAFVTFSSDLVFGAGPLRPLVESDRVAPQSCYGRSKVAAEAAVTALQGDALVIRTSAFFGDWDRSNFVSRTLAEVFAGRDVHVPDDCQVSPTYLTDLVHVVYDLLIDGERGIWHLANTGGCSWMQLAQMAASHAGLDASRVGACTSAAFGWHAPRPPYTVLGSERGALMGGLDDALARYCQSRPWERIAISERDRIRERHPASPSRPRGHVPTSRTFV